MNGKRNIVDDLANVAREAAAGRLEAGMLKRTVLSDCYQNVQRALALAVEAVRWPSPGIRSEVETISDQVKKRAEELMSQVATGLASTDSKNLDTVRQQTIFVDGLLQISSLANRVVQSMTQQDVMNLSENRRAVSRDRAVATT